MRIVFKNGAEMWADQRAVNAMLKNIREHPNSTTKEWFVNDTTGDVNGMIDMSEVACIMPDVEVPTKKEKRGWRYWVGLGSLCTLTGMGIVDVMQALFHYFKP